MYFYHFYCILILIKYLNGGLNALFAVFWRRTAMMKKMTIYLFASFFMMLLVSSASAKVTISSEYKYKVLPDEGIVKSCEDQGYLSSCPANADCNNAKGGCQIFIQCKYGYVDITPNDGIYNCIKNDCSDYPLTDCNDNRGTVEKCKTDATKCKYTECKNGFSSDSSGNCVCSGSGVSESSTSCKCNAGEGWTPKSGDYAPCKASGCGNFSTNPNCGTDETSYDAGIKSGGKICYGCKSTYQCSVYYSDKSECTPSGIGWSLVDDGTTDKDGKKCQKCSCSATDHTLTAKPDATTTNFTTGCNSKYKFISCKTDAGYYSQEACYETGGVNYGPLSYWTAANMGL